MVNDVERPLTDDVERPLTDDVERPLTDDVERPTDGVERDVLVFLVFFLTTALIMRLWPLYWDMKTSMGSPMDLAIRVANPSLTLTLSRPMNGTLSNSP